MTRTIPEKSHRISYHTNARSLRHDRFNMHQPIYTEFFWCNEEIKQAPRQFQPLVYDHDPQATVGQIEISGSQ
ncbi:hypothetical protein TNCV_4114471 [Trichonephila clavipes]|nr:hypothetical protein TNCV_4114471 [Trichonephila clavipes]